MHNSCCSDCLSDRYATNLLLSPGVTLPSGLTSVITGSITESEFNNNPFLVRSSTRVRDFELNADTWTNVESFYVGDDYKFAKDWMFSIGARWDYEQGYSAG